jgi:hypothetical protein
MPLIRRWRRSRSGKDQAAAADAEEQVKALRATVDAYRVLVDREKHWLIATIAALVLLIGFILVANRDSLKQAVSFFIPAPSTEIQIPDIDAADAAFQKRDDTTALRLVRPLAERGNARAQLLLGLIYDRGHAVPQDMTQASKWFRLAAEQGDAAAQLQLGIRYSEGHGEPQNFAEAAKWFRLAADQGNAHAQYQLGLLYSRGEGVPQSNIDAHMWFNLAAAHFLRSEADFRKAAAKNRDAVAFKMTKAEIAEAQQRAREWQPTEP